MSQKKRTKKRNRWWNRHETLTIVAVNIVIFLLIFSAIEVFLRIYLPYNPGYYMVFLETPGEYQFPYGVIKRNAFGFEDDDFDLESSKPRIGYFGDSVTRGVGAGHGYRISELLEEAYPHYEHWNFGILISGIQEPASLRALELVHKYSLDVVIYLLNLNDVLPSEPFFEANDPSRLAALKSKLQWLDWLRGRSYLYTLIRSRVRLFLAQRGYGYHGWKAAELFPTENLKTIHETAERICVFAQQLERQGVKFVVLILPYEMQISKQAAQTYWESGIRWEDGFLNGNTQRMLIDGFSGCVSYIDALGAFLGEAPFTPSPEHAIGQYFVYNQGDTLDWNHPNREGHRVIAEWLIKKGFIEATMTGGGLPARGQSDENDATFINP